MVLSTINQIKFTNYTVNSGSGILVKILLKFRNVCLIVLLACFSGSVIAQTAEIDPVRDYHDHCSVCHGETGDGKSHAMAGLVPPPLDFTTIGLESTLDRQRMINAVANGKPGTAMSAWKSRLSDERIEALVDYIRAEFMRGSRKEPVTARDHPGRLLYAETCSMCHGDDGHGSTWGENSLNQPPREFTSTESAAELSLERIALSIANGRPGTAMAAYSGRLSEEQIAVLADYVWTVLMGKSGGGESAD